MMFILSRKRPLSASPPVGFDVLERRLNQRLAARGVSITEVHEVERCLFPMNLPMPDFSQPVVGFGGAASMVHPATGYMVGALLRRSPSLADAIATAVNAPLSSPASIAQAGLENALESRSIAEILSLSLWPRKADAV